MMIKHRNISDARRKMSKKIAFRSKIITAHKIKDELSKFSSINKKKKSKCKLPHYVLTPTLGCGRVTRDFHLRKMKKCHFLKHQHIRTLNKTWFRAFFRVFVAKRESKEIHRVAGPLALCHREVSTVRRHVRGLSAGAKALGQRVLPFQLKRKLQHVHERAGAFAEL